jgi:DNA-binding response OmpR family regulator
VLYMSGYSEELASGRARIPPELFLEKPFDRGTLLKRVRATLTAQESDAVATVAAAFKAPTSGLRRRRAVTT